MKKKIVFLLFSIMLLTSCAKKYMYQNISSGTDKKALINELGKQPSNEETKDGNEYLTFEQCPYLGYEGTTTYCLSDDKLMFSRWEYSSKDFDECKKVYDAVKTEKTNTYGEGQETASGKNTYMCTWIQDENSISVTCIEEKGTITVCLTEVSNKEA